ncbi:MAG: hypothetical protein K1X75_12065 [Leptospirales bacterium]|nr:hypothetical protein [Leptospirales bacterium]
MSRRSWPSIIAFAAAMLATMFPATLSAQEEDRRLQLELFALAQISAQRYLPPLADAAALQPPRRRSRLDHGQSAGLQMYAARRAGEEPGPILHADLAVFVVLGRALYIDPAHGDAHGGDRPLEIVPGNQLYGGFDFAPGVDTEASLLLGRLTSRDALDNSLLGAHGSLTGIHANFCVGDLLYLRVAPLHRPELAGAYLLSSGGGQQQLYAPLRFRRSFQNAAADARSYGYRAELVLGNEYRLALGYGVNRQNREPASAEEAAAQRPAAANNAALPIDRIEYASIGLGLDHRSSLNLQLGLSYENTRGDYASALWNEQNRPVERIEGAAMRWLSYIKYSEFYGSFSALLPTPADQRSGSQPQSSERSGYVGFGGESGGGGLLGASLDMRPWAELCSSADSCAGLRRSGEETSYRLPSFELQLELGYEAASGGAALAAHGLIPLAAARPGANRFRLLRADPEAPRFGELELRLWRSLQSDYKMSLHYVRSYRRYGRRGKRELMGESLSFSLEARL